MKHRLCLRGELPLCETRRFELADGRSVALYHLEDGFFATDDLCTHGEANLSDGLIEDGRIICPYHLGAFDIRTGEATDAPCYIPIKTYPVIEIDNEIFVED